ncbi:MAG TPA: alpha/beta hydrolase [Solirubrobacterales bacterium]|nr:alpha/beta hydrolase [Solirubrobacterales bacterium]
MDSEQTNTPWEVDDARAAAPPTAPLHPDSLELVARAAELGVADLEGLTIEEVREVELRELVLKGAPAAVAEVRDAEVPTAAGPVPVRIYVPAGEPLAAVLYVHGGGWASGSIELSDPDCRELASRAGVTVVSVEYRLAPGHPFPAGIEDCYAALRWVAARRDELAPGGGLAVAGSSAGANLAAAAALMARDRGELAIDLQVLLSPVLDLGFDSGSYREAAGAVWFEPADMRALAADYLGATTVEAAGAYAAPARAEDLSGLPPALIVSAEHDILRDEAELYGKRLREAGVSARVVRFPGVLHGFYEYRAVFAAAELAWETVATDIRGAFS